MEQTLHLTAGGAQTVPHEAQKDELHCRYVGSGLHGGIKEFLASMNDEEAVGVISNLVRVQAVVGTGAAVREGEHSFATLDCPKKEPCR